MNLHNIQHRYPGDTVGFYVHASNIHSGEMQSYGPFPGQPGFTYEFLRCGEPMNPPDDHIFSFAEDRPGHANDDLGWRDQEGDLRSDGWRRCYYREGQFGLEHGPYWTDLSIEWILFPTPPTWESNQYPET